MRCNYDESGEEEKVLKMILQQRPFVDHLPCTEYVLSALHIHSNPYIMALMLVTILYEVTET